MNQPCNRCHTDWPYDRMLVLEGYRLCELCWRVVIYPRKTTVAYQHSRKLAARLDAKAVSVA